MLCRWRNHSTPNSNSKKISFLNICQKSLCKIFAERVSGQRNWIDSIFTRRRLNQMTKSRKFHQQLEIQMNQSTEFTIFPFPERGIIPSRYSDHLCCLSNSHLVEGNSFETENILMDQFNLHLGPLLWSWGLFRRISRRRSIYETLINLTMKRLNLKFYDPWRRPITRWTHFNSLNSIKDKEQRRRYTLNILL